MTLRFDGPDVDSEDVPRLGKQLVIVKDIMLDGGWHTLAELAAKANASTASVSARVRDLRKKRNGSYTIVREKTEQPGVFHYRLLKPLSLGIP